MKQHLIVFTAIVLLSLGLVGGTANAHVLKTDGTIGAVLHIEPDDNPTTGKPTVYSLAFRDTADKFTLENCNCNISIQESGQTLSTQPLRSTDSLDSTNTYTFPKPDVYTLSVAGRPLDGSSFQSFSLTYLVRVAGGVGTPGTGEKPFPPLLWAGIGMCIGLVLLGAYVTGHTDREEI